MPQGTLVVELRRVTPGGATTLLASAHPDVVQAVRQAWARLIYSESAGTEAGEPAEAGEAAEVRQ